MLDLSASLQGAIRLDNALFEERDLLIGPTAHLQHAVVNADRALTALFEDQSDYQLEKPEKAAEKARQFARTLHWFLVVSARLQWTHLIVLSPAQYDQLCGVEPATELADLDREYLAIKHLFLQSYYTHRQEDFRHAWHALLKLGLVDYQLSEEAVTAALKQLPEEAGLKN